MDTLETKVTDSLYSDSEKRRLVGSSWRRLFWLAILIGSSFIFSVSLACATPLAALGAVAAITLRRRDALVAGGMVWLVNQCAGYIILRYPWSPNSVGWGAALGAATLLAGLAARWSYTQQRAVPIGFRITTSFAAAFVAFEAAIYAAAFFILGGLQDFTFGIVSYLFVINAVTFLGLLVLYSLVTPKRFAPFLFARRSSRQQPVKTIC
jgi:hypothetical protein